jgi:hypothetical protein
MSLARILVGYAVVFGVPTLGVAWLFSGRKTPSMPPIQPKTVPHTIIICVRDRGRAYADSWVLDWRDGVAKWRVVEFAVSLGLLWRACVHSLVAALAYPDGPDGEIDHGLCWTPIEMHRTPLWTARIIVVGSGVSLAVASGWPQWGWPTWVEWMARAYLFANVGVWIAEPIAIVRDYKHHATE